MNIRRLPKHRHRLLSFILCAVIVFVMFPISTSRVLAEVDDIVTQDVSSYEFEDENGDSIEIFIPDPFHNDECIARICGPRLLARTLYDYSDRVESYETVIKEICARPLLNKGSIRARAAEVLAKTDIPFEMWDTITNALEYVGLNQGEALADAKTFSEQMKAVFLKIKDGDNPHFDDNPIYEAVGLAVADVQATLIFVDLHFATILYDLLATEEAQCRLNLLKNLTQYIEADAWQEAVNNVQINAELSETGYWGQLINVIDDKKGEIATGAVSLFSALAGINIKWKLLLLEWKVIMAIANQEELVQNAAIAATVHNFLKEYGDSNVFGVRQLLEYSQISFYDYMISACDTLLTKWKDLLSFGHNWKDMADWYKGQKADCLSSDSGAGPSISIITPVSGTTITGETQFTVQVDDNIGVVYVELKADGQIIDDPATPDVEGLLLPVCEEVFPAEYTVYCRLPDSPGGVTIEATAFDAADNPASQEISLIVDASPRLTIGLEPSSVEKGTSYVISGVLTDANLATLEDVTVSAKTSSSFVGSDQTDPDGQYSITAVAPNSPGSHEVTVEAIHNGNVATASDQLIVTDPKSGHDVSITDFHLSTYAVQPSGSVTLYATFDNHGKYDENITVHWYLYSPDGSQVRYVTRNYGTIVKETGSTGEKSQTLQTNSATGTWSAQVWLELDTDESPSDNQRTLPFYVGNQPEIDRYGVENFVRHYNSSSPAILGDFSVTVGGLYSNPWRVRFTVNDSQTELIPDNDYAIFYGGSCVIYHLGGQHYPEGQTSFDLWAYPPDINFSAESKEAIVPRGGTAVYTVQSNEELTTALISRANQDGVVIRDVWDSFSIERDTPSILTIDVPIDAEMKTYDFWIELKFGTTWVAQRVELEVLSEHDVSVSNLNPSNGSHYNPGDTVEISATVTAAGGYTEHPNITLSITSPNGYSHTEAKRLSITGSQTVDFSSWDTAGLQPGEYTITVNALIGDDANGGNDSTTSIVHLDEPPPLSIVALPDSTSHYQGDKVEITATVTDDGPVTDANTLATITWPDNSHADLAMLYDSNLEAYICQFTATQQGAYSVSVTTSKTGYTDGSSELIDINVINKQPDTMILSAYPIFSGWSHQAQVTFKWNGSDTGTAQSDLLYTWKLDDGSWNSYSNHVSTTLASLTEGQHTFQVKAYDEALEDTTPASRSFSVDSQPPSVVITTNNGDDFITDLSQVTLQGTASDAVPGSGLVEVVIEGGWDNGGTLSNWSFEVNLQAGENILTVIGMDGAGNIATDSIVITYSEIEEIQLSLQTGWNMISLPVEPGTTDPDVVLPDVEAIYTWNCETMSYDSPSEIVPDKSYWALVFEDVTETIYGTPVEGYQLSSDCEGWHMIGGLSAEAEVIVDYGDVYDTLYHWNPETLSYIARPLDDVRPGEGYWLLAFTDFSISVVPKPPVP